MEVEPRSAVSVSESTAHMEALLTGLGIGQTFTFGARRHLETGRLVSVLADWTPRSHPLHLVYPASPHQSAKLRAFADWTVEIFARMPGRVR
jgi:DNA-binding transcriptional LysR family regulator